MVMKRPMVAFLTQSLFQGLHYPRCTLTNQVLELVKALDVGEVHTRELTDRAGDILSQRSTGIADASFDLGPA
jgi:hypothetical protein